MHVISKTLMRKSGLLLLINLVWALAAHAQIELCTEAQLTTSDGDHTPLWLNANKHGLSSLDKTNGYMRIGAFRHLESDSAKSWKMGLGIDLALASHFTSTFIAHQLYGEIAWHKGLLTLGAKAFPLQLKNSELSTGSQTLGINARPVPGIRIELPDYWDIPGTNGFIGLKGHIFYGWTTDDRWQRDFTEQRSRFTEHTMLHTKAGYLRFGKAGKPVNVELGLEMACQFGGNSTVFDGKKQYVVENDGGLSGILRAFIPGGGEANDQDYHNEMGNHVGSWVARINYDNDSWGASVYADHFFEDQSQMFFLDYDGYGTGEQWDSWEHFNWMLYDLRDIQLGAELRLKYFHWIDAVVAEYIYTKYQSGPIYHDHTKTMPDHVSGLDHYYYHSVFTGWQHWGQVMGNPLYRSPLYNENGWIDVADSRFWGLHLGMSGSPLDNLHYRLLATWQKGFGTYLNPFLHPQENLSLLAEIAYTLPEHSPLKGWSIKGAFALDRGKLLGDNTGMQLTIGKRLLVNTKKK